jgi:RepB DNA-primase from phage plasmid
VTNLSEAFRMLGIFASCGAQSIVLTKTELEWKGHKKVKWGKTYSLEALREKLPQILRTADIKRPVTLPEGQIAMAGENVIIRPTSPDIAFVQLDDLKTQEQLERVRSAAFIIHETSPGNHQAWIAVSGVPAGKEEFKEFMRRVRKGVGGNDKSASHATRLAGTENWKAKYLPNPPVVKILEAYPGRVMTPVQLESMGLLAEPEPEQSCSVIELHPRRARLSQDRERQWPDYQRCLQGAPPASEGNGPSRSHADFFWCKMAAQRGWSIEEAASKLLEVSEKARERARCRDEGYALVTAQNAAAAAARGRQTGRG